MAHNLTVHVVRNKHVQCQAIALIRTGEMTSQNTINLDWKIQAEE